MAQLMRGVLGGIKTGCRQMLFDQLVNRRSGNTLMILLCNKQRIDVHEPDAAAFHKPILKRLLAGIVQEDHAFLVAFTKDPKLITADIGNIEPDKLGYAQTAV